MNDDQKLKINELQMTHALAHFNSVISMAELALKSSILINGGAAISLLTFVGNDSGASKELIVLGLFVFALGVLLGGIATLLAYLTQNNYLNQINEKKTPNDDERHKHIAIITCGASYACFFSGIVLSGCGILG